MEEGRRSVHERNRGLEELLAELSVLLAPAEEAALSLPRERDWPVVLVVGLPRSGTTLAMQWLATSGAFAYPTNLLSRFYAAPAIGARVQELLTNPQFAFRDELEGLAAPVDFHSDLGKTRGPLAPNEFWYFWRRFLPTVGIEPIGDLLDEVDAEGLNAELAAVADVFGKPFALKGLMWVYDLPGAARLLPTAVFLHVERDPVYNAQSLLEARERFFGDRERWYSARPPEAATLDALTPVEQVIGQVVYTQRHIAAGLREVDPTRKLHVRYDAFCRDPASTWRELAVCLAAQGCDLPSYDGPARFDDTDQPRLPAEDLDALRAALEALESAS